MAESIREQASQLATEMGYCHPFQVKVTESKACIRGQTDMPAYDVFIKTKGSARGRHVFTIVVMR